MRSKLHFLRLYAIIIFTLLFFQSEAQNLITSRKSSYKTYIYQISDKEAKKINKNGMYKVDSTYLHTLVTSYPTDSIFDEKLLPGHYLKTYTDQNHQIINYAYIPDLDVKIFNNNTDLCIRIYDLKGNNVSDAVVKIGLKILQFDKLTQCYIDRKSNKKGLLSVKRNENTAFYQLSRQYNNSPIRRTTRKLVYGTPLKYIWIPASYVVKIPVDGVNSIIKNRPVGVISRISYFFRRLPYKISKLFDPDPKDYNFTRKYKGYMVFNKPKYMPNDTVKFKAYIVDKNGIPLKKNVDVCLYTGKKFIQLQNLKPYKKGAFEFQFFLHDSLNLKLDRSYNIELNNKKGNTYIEKNFYYEQYELGKNKLNIRIENDNQFAGKCLTAFVKGTDENDLNLLDARLEVFVEANHVETYFDDRIFVPDTLFTFKTALKPTGETEILIPDSIFPKLNFKYNLNVRLLTSDNELITEKNQVSYYFAQKKFDIKLINDSVQFVYFENGQSVSKPVHIYATDNFGNKTDILQSATPCKVELNPFYSQYHIKGDSISQTFDMNSQSSLLQCMSQRVNDSVFVEVNNPRKLNFVYNIYKKNTEKYRGSGDSLLLRNVSRTKQNYFISIRYLWGGQIKNENYWIPYYDKKLNIAVKQPHIVYPGQKVNMEISVTDQKGKPVSNVDLTAYSLTSKFKYDAPTLPYLGKMAANKEIINNFTLKNNLQDQSKMVNLNYETWKILAAIDSIEYYKFLYPGSAIYRFNYKVSNNITQFSPYVVSESGELLPIKVIYLDSKPVYFCWSTISQPYSFKIDSGYHNIKLRTSYRTITIDSLYFKLGEKVIFSIKEKFTSNHIKSEKSEPKLSQYERNLLFRYIFPYRNNFGENFAWIENDNNVQLLNVSENKRSYGQNFAGPISGKVTFNLMKSYSSDFNHEAYFEYDFAPNLLKMREIRKSLYPDILSYFNPSQNMSDEVLTKQKIETEWNNYLELKRKQNARYVYPSVTKSGAGKLQIDYEAAINQQVEFPLNVLLFRYDTPKFLRIYPGNVDMMHQLEKGLYRVIVFYPGANYQVVDSVSIKVNGLNYCRILQSDIVPKDSFSLNVSDLIEKNLFRPTPSPFSENYELSTVYNQYQQKYAYDGVGSTISGVVYEESTKEPIIGATINIKGTSYGTITNMKGEYSIKIPSDKHILVVSFIGYLTEEIDLQRSNTTAIGLKEDYKALDEVVVVGYGVQKKSNLTAAVSTIRTSDVMGGIPAISGNINQVLQGKVAGIDVSSGANIRIRGQASIEFEKAPLFVIDGKVFTGNIKDLDPALIDNLEVLKDAAATAIYGLQGANGVVLITTKPGTFKTTDIADSKGAEYDNSFFSEATKASSIRENFSDYAYWQPHLITDKNGKVSFDVTFPDDVTRWDTFVLGMNDKKQAGQTSGSIKSYKPVMAQLAVPSFVLESDTTYVIGKSLNYSPDSINVTTNFEVGYKKVFGKQQIVVNSILDTLQIVAPDDSIKVRYSLIKQDGYFDGEQRKIPVFKLGLEETRGNFHILDKKDTTIICDFDSQLGDVTLYAHADYLNVIEDEISKLITYQYNCNEQIASKLKALLAEKLIATYKGKTFKNDDKIERLIRLLMKNKNKKELWGWWKDSETHYPFSAHVLDALNSAKSQGFKVDIDETKLSEMLIYELDKNSLSDVSKSLAILKILKSFNGAINYQSYIHKIENLRDLGFNNYLKIIELKQMCGLKYTTDTLDKFQQKTLFGNTYYSDKSKKQDLEDNDIQNTLIVYRVLRNGTQQNDSVLSKMRLYFLEAKQSHGWRNTYESAQILGTILPDLLRSNKKWEKSTLKFTGDLNITINEFPFETKLNANSKINIIKSGSDPIYLTTYQRKWNKNPKFKNDDFKISTHFESNTLHLKAGESIKLIVDLEVIKDADYIMLNIPIPGGCSYGDKGNYNKNEVHREYFKNQTGIFCQKLKQGSYTFEINLIPRFNGIYTLNPAKVELMYYPTFNSNNEPKKVIVD